MTKRILALLALFGALFLALAAPASATDPNSGTTQITGAPDGGHHGDWASDDFTRYTTVAKDDDGYTVTINDDGHFTTFAGAASPRNGVTLPDAPVTGTLKGQMTFHVVSEVAPDTGLLPKSVNGKPNTSDWPRRLFPPNTDVAITSTGYTWTYATDCESWTDSSDNNDGSDDSAGDVTGKACPTTSPSTSASPSSSGAVPVTASASSTATAVPTLPVTGAPLTGVLVLGVAVLVGGAVLVTVSRRRRRTEG
jgi:LPXTG-motif cell wall-anchored protein